MQISCKTEHLCDVISFVQVETNPERRFEGNLSKEYGFIIKIPERDTLVIEMSKEEMFNLINNAVTYLMPEYTLVPIVIKTDDIKIVGVD